MSENKIWQFKYQRIPEWSKEGIVTIKDEEREYLYSLIKGEKLSYGYSQIITKDEERNYVEELDCCKILLKIDSDYLPQIDRVNHTLFGYINKQGEVINGLVDLQTGKRYFDEPSCFDLPYNIEKLVKKELEIEISDNYHKELQIKRHNKHMVKSLKRRSNL